MISSMVLPAVRTKRTSSSSVSCGGKVTLASSILKCPLYSLLMLVHKNISLNRNTRRSLAFSRFLRTSSAPSLQMCRVGSNKAKSNPRMPFCILMSFVKFSTSRFCSLTWEAIARIWLKVLLVSPCSLVPALVCFRISRTSSS